VPGSWPDASIDRRACLAISHAPFVAARHSIQENIMSIAKVIELSASSSKGIQDAVQGGLRKCAESIKNIKGAYVNEIKVVTDDKGNIEEWRVHLKVTFLVN
jgi:hypothetical protein